MTVAVISSSLDDDREEHDRRSLSLEPGALELLRVLRETGRPLVVLLQNGAPVEMPFADGCAALLEMFLAGSGGEEAAARILCGEVNPSGRLAETVPYRFEDCPAADFDADERARSPITRVSLPVIGITPLGRFRYGIPLATA